MLCAVGLARVWPRAIRGATRGPAPMPPHRAGVERARRHCERECDGGDEQHLAEVLPNHRPPREAERERHAALVWAVAHASGEHEVESCGPTATEPAASVVKRGDGAEDGVVHRPAREVRLRLGRELEDSCDTDLRASVLHVDARHLRVDGRAAHAEGTAHGEAVLLGELPAHEHAVVGALRDGSPSTSRRCPLAK